MKKETLSDRRKKKIYRARCIHRYRGLYGKFEPRFKQRKIDGQWYFCTDYKCQIIGCNHWKLNHFIHKMERMLPNRKKRKEFEEAQEK